MNNSVRNRLAPFYLVISYLCAIFCGFAIGLGVATFADGENGSIYFIAAASSIFPMGVYLCKTINPRL